MRVFVCSACVRARARVFVSGSRGERKRRVNDVSLAPSFSLGSLRKREREQQARRRSSDMRSREDVEARQRKRERERERERERADALGPAFLFSPLSSFFSRRALAAFNFPSVAMSSANSRFADRHDETKRKKEMRKQSSLCSAPVSHCGAALGHANRGGSESRAKGLCMQHCWSPLIARARKRAKAVQRGKERRRERYPRSERAGVRASI